MWTKEEWVEVNRLIDEGYITKRFNSDNSLYILNYGQKAQFESLWNKYTLNSRGHIYRADTNQIIARPFGKFFNYEEIINKDLGFDVPNLDFDAFDKADGSLGILYKDLNGDYKISTRGSMESEQAIEGTKILNEKYGDICFRPHVTYLFEIIFPENRIVIDYKDKRDLILLATIDTESGQDIPLYPFGMPLIKQYNGVTDFTTLKEKFGKDNMEGFVIKFSNGFRMKIKLEEYVRLHRILTGVNEKTIWDVLRNNESLESFLEGVPEEFETWIRKVDRELKDKFESIMEECISIKKEIDKKVSIEESIDYRDYKKKIAKEVLKIENKDFIGVIFSMIDGRDFFDHIWKMIKPSGNVTYTKEEE